MGSAAQLVDENLRRVSARLTKQIALRYGDRLPAWIGCGYPKSGTVWLCQLMASYLGVPYPQNYRTPIAMKSVLHAHWPYDKRMPPTGYIVRDGRDVMISFYFFHMQALTQQKNPTLRFRLSRTYERALGKGFDPNDSANNLPRFIELVMERGWATHGITWPDHVRQWTRHTPTPVGVVRYEDLLLDTSQALTDLMTEVTGEPGDPERAALAARRYEFGMGAGRARGTEDRASFQRKGIAGDWRNHFTRESAEIFDSYAGDVLVQLGYAADRNWYRELP